MILSLRATVPHLENAPATCLWVSRRTRALGTHRKFELDFCCCCFILLFFFSDLQSLWNLLVTRIYYICYSTCFYSWETALFRKRGRETFLLWNFRDCCEWHTYTSGVSIGSAQTKGCHSGRAVSFMKDAATCWTFPLMITKKWGASCYCFCSCYVEEDVVM